MAAGPVASPRLMRLARSGRVETPVEERCDLCGAPVPASHRHLIDVESRRLMCACRPCSILFHNPAAAEGRLRLLPERRVLLEGFALDDEGWAALDIPVDMAFFFRASPAGRVVAFYPGPMGATESQLELTAWREIEAANPALAELEPDVEALLVNRAHGAREHYLVPVDDCYRLAGLIRGRWRGFTGGREVWAEIAGFFDELRGRAERVPEGREE